MSHERMDENMVAYISRSSAARHFCAWYMKWIYFPMFDHHITVSEHTSGELIRASRGHKVRRGIWISPMGVDCDNFSPDRKSSGIRQRLIKLTHATQDSTILFYAGRLAPEKNLPLLLDTVAQLDPTRYRLAIAGTGIMLKQLREACTAMALSNVVFLGHVADRNLLAGYYASTDIFAHPNPREPYGIAPLEAMASGVPLVAPNTGGLTSYANSTNAWLADANPAAFADAIRAAVASTDDRAARVTAARDKALERSWPIVAARYLQLYRELNSLTRGEQMACELAARTWSTRKNETSQKCFLP